MVTLAERVEFAEKFLTDRDGRPFTLTPERQWVLDEFWKAADGFKWWPIDRARLCLECAELAGTLTEWTLDNPTRSWPHQATGCAGLELQPIVCTILNLPRREGKTFNTAGFNLSTVFKDAGKSILYVAAADKQTDKLFRDNYELPIARQPALAERSKIVGNLLTVPQKGSMLECVPTAWASITGTGRTHVVIDEARDVDGRVLMAAIPSIFAENGKQCPTGKASHSRTPLNSEQRDCSICGQRLVPWFARLVIMSSSGLLEGSDKEWFNDLIEHLEQNPDQNFHLFRKHESSNPNIHKGTKDAIARVFGAVPALKELTEVEVFNRPTRKGDRYLTKQQIDACIDRNLGNQEGSVRPCVGFLDTSTTRELTSVVLFEEMPQPPEEPHEPFRRIRCVRIQVWDPATEAEHTIDEGTVLPWLDIYMPMFPGLRELHVDVRLQPWGERLVKICKRGGDARKAWGHKVVAFRGNVSERLAGWDCFEQRVLARTIVLPHHPILLKELAAVRVTQRLDGRTEVRDASRKKRHADVAEGVATCCYLAHVETLTRRRSGLAEIEEREKTSTMISRLYRPQVRGLNANSF